MIKKLVCAVILMTQPALLCTFEELEKAIDQPDILQLKRLLQAGQTQEDKNEALASIIGRAEYDEFIQPDPLSAQEALAMLRLLINYDAHSNHMSWYMSGGQTPLQIAILFAVYPEIISLLLNHGADPTKLTRNGTTLLEELKAKQLNIQECLEISTHYGQTKAAVAYDQQLKNLEQSKSLLESYPILLDDIQNDPTHETLQKAIIYGLTNLVRQLLQAGIQPNADDLALAKQKDHKEIGRMLIAHLGITGYRSGISKTGILNAEEDFVLPPEVGHHIATFMHSPAPEHR